VTSVEPYKWSECTSDKSGQKSQKEAAELKIWREVRLAFVKMREL
jgi:hypothetical protein